MIHRVPDPSAVDLDQLFEVEWRKNLFSTAIERIKPRFTLKQLQIFDLHALQKWPAADVARSLRISLANVYVTKHRVATAVKREARRLEREMEERVKCPPKDASIEAG
jgi:DNA-directed RNA polymerase specialized sigma24 family protein